MPLPVTVMLNIPRSKSFYPRKKPNIFSCGGFKGEKLGHLHHIVFPAKENNKPSHCNCQRSLIKTKLKEPASF